MLYLQGHRSATSVKLSRAVGLPYLKILLVNPSYLFTLLLGLPYLLVNRALDATVIFYSLYSLSFSPRGRFVFQTEISGKYIVLVLISRLFYFLSSLRRRDQSTVFCIVSFDFN